MGFRLGDVVWKGFVIGYLPFGSGVEGDGGFVDLGDYARGLLVPTVV